MAFFAVSENGSSASSKRFVRNCQSNVEFTTAKKVHGDATYRTDSPVSNVSNYKHNRYFEPIAYARSVSSVASTAAETNRSDDAIMYVPPLTFDRGSLCSKEFLTYTNRQNDHHHLRHTEAYKEWLCSKIESKKNADRKNMEDALRMQQARSEQDSYRRRLRESKLKEWFQRKQNEANAQLEELRLQQLQEVFQPTDPTAPMKNYMAWLQKKQIYQTALRERKKRESNLYNEYVRRRKELAESVYADWLKAAKDKPKPVPMNQGFFSLKGTISSIYTNPLPWVSVIDNELRAP